VREVNILIYCKTRLKKRKRKQYILGITLQPLNRKKKNILQLNVEPVVFSQSLSFFATRQTTAVRAQKTFKQTRGRKYLQIPLYGSGLLRSFPQKNTTSARKFRQLQESMSE